MTGKNKAFARYAKYSNQVRGGILRPELFTPNAELKLSIFRIDHISEGEIIEAGIKNVVKKDRYAHSLYGWGVFTKSQIKTELGLCIDFNNEPENHADIFGFPDDDEALKKLRQKMAKLAFPKILDDPIPEKKG